MSRDPLADLGAADPFAGSGDPCGSSAAEAGDADDAVASIGTQPMILPGKADSTAVARSDLHWRRIELF